MYTSPLKILLEKTKHSCDKRAEVPLEKRKEISNSNGILLIDGSMCDEYSTGGSLVTSGIKQVSPPLAFEKSGKNQSSDVAILSINCITECLILQFVLEKYNKSTIVLSLSI